MKTEKSKWELISDILKVIREEEKANKTRIMQSVYLDLRNFQKYFDFLLDEGFIARCNPIPDHYELTENGRNLSKRLMEISEILESYNH